MDIEEISKQLGNMDIYMLDHNLNVVASSLKEEIGMNFNAYKDFSAKLKERLKGDKFESDDINFSLMGSELRKYSYMPTPDKKYLIELSVTIKDVYPEFKNLNIIYLSNDLKNQYDFVEDIYKYNKEDGLSWWRSYVTEIIYNDQVLQESLSQQKKMFLQGIGVITFLYFGFAFALAYLLGQNQKIAYQDHLSKLPNRKRFEEEMKSKMATANRKEAHRIKCVIPKGDMVSRLGGDELTVLISGIRSPEEVIRIGETMSNLFIRSLTIGSKEISVKPSIGISVYPDNGDTVEKLILKADTAMYKAKQDQLNYKIY